MLISAGKSRQHRRVVCPTSYCLSLDVCGPFCPGTDQEETGCRYGLIAVYTVPVDAHGSPLPQGLVELQTGKVGEVDEDQEQHDESPAVGQDERILEEAAEDEEQDLSEAEIKQVEINEEKWKEFIKGTRAQAVRNITFGVPMRSREAGEVVKATSRILAKVKAMQLPILRLHTDRAREFAGSRFQRWLADRDLFHTMCGGDEPQSNARAEREAQAVKSSMRTLLLAAKAPTHFWPLALRQSVELRHRQQLRSLGVVLPEVLPFGCRAIVKRKTWHNRADPFRWPMMKVRLWGPAQDMAASSRGYFVQGSDGKFFRSTVVKMPDAIAQDGPLQLDQHQGEPQEELPEPGNLPGGEEDGRDQGQNEQQEPANKEQDVGLLEDPGLKPDQGETPCQFDRWCVDPREGIGGGSSSRTKGMDGLFNMDLGLEMEEITDREVLMLQPTKASKRRYHGKCPPRNEDIDGVAARKVAIDEAEDYKKQVGEERMEDVMVQQLFALEKWIKSVSEAITSGKVDEEEIKLAVRAREETIAMEAMLQERKVCKIQMEQNEQQVLQTRSVGMDEVKKDLEAWTPVFAEEVRSLTEALEPIDEKQFHEILKGNYDVECLPMKAIATLKPPNRKKGRVVVCGNFSSEKEGEELYNAAGGVDSVTIRTLLNLATHRGWTAATIDVKGAFLQAPRRTATTRVTIGEPPPILVAMGLTKPNERWVIKHAPYGLQESPGDWGYHRDKKLVAAQWQLQGCSYRMVQTAERHVWKIVSDDEEGPHGFVLTYVDDMLILGNQNHVEKVTEVIGSLWQCSPPEFLNEQQAMRFCGFELSQQGKGIRLSQEGYTRDLLERYQIEESDNTSEVAPLPKLTDEDMEGNPTPQDLRSAQSLVGELLWLSTKTRPDLSFSVGALGRMVRKNPKRVCELGMQTLRYLGRTADLGLLFIYPVKKGILVNQTTYNFRERLVEWRCMLMCRTLRLTKGSGRSKEWRWNTQATWWPGKVADSHSSVIQRQSRNW